MTGSDICITSRDMNCLMDLKAARMWHFRGALEKNTAQVSMISATFFLDGAFGAFSDMKNMLS